MRPPCMSRDNIIKVVVTYELKGSTDFSRRRVELQVVNS